MSGTSGTGNKAGISSSPEQPRLLRQAHGGALLSGGLRGHNGSRAGRPSSAAARLALDERIPLLEQIADGEVKTVVRDADGRERSVVQTVPIRERITAIAELGRIGMGPPVSSDDVLMRLVEQTEVLRSLLDSATCERVLTALADVWK